MERISYQDIPKGMFETLMEVEKFISNSSLDMPLIGLIKLRASQINGCAYCVDMHHKELQHQGEKELRLVSLCVWEETPYYTQKERAVLHFTEASTLLSHKPIPSAVFEALLDYFSKQEIAYLTLVVAQINTWNRLMKVFQTTPGQYKVQP